MIVGGAGLLLANIPLMLPRSSRWASTRPSSGRSNTRSCRSICTRTKCSAAPAWSKPAPISRSSAGTILAGMLADAPIAAAATIGIAVLGYLAGRRCRRRRPRPSASVRLAHHPRLDPLVSATMHIPRLFLAILSISFFWTIGAVLIIIFPPLVKNVLGADEQVASLFIAIFSIGIAIGSVLINRLLKSEVSARFAPASVILMGAVRAAALLRRAELGRARARADHARQFHFPPDGRLDDRSPARRRDHRRHVRRAALRLPDDDRADKSQTARTVAANNIVNSGAMVIGSLLAFA
jgi:hypothetical protein